MEINVAMLKNLKQRTAKENYSCLVGSRSKEDVEIPKVEFERRFRSNGSINSFLHNYGST